MHFVYVLSIHLKVLLAVCARLIMDWLKPLGRNTQRIVTADYISPLPEEERLQMPMPLMPQWGDPRKMEEITNQAVTIRGCGAAGNIVQASLGILGILFPQVGVTVECGRCTRVNVQVPIGTTHADVEVCVDPGKSTCQHCILVCVHALIVPYLVVLYRYWLCTFYVWSTSCDTVGTRATCVKVKAAPNCRPSIFAASIPLTIPVGSGTTQAVLKIDVFGQYCASVEFNAPACP